MSIVKSQILNQLADQYPNFLRKDLEKSFNLVFDEIIKTLAKEQRVEIRFFGIFETKKIKSRIGVNPKSGVKIKVAEKKKVKWKMSKDLRIRINE